MRTGRYIRFGVNEDWRQAREKEAHDLTYSGKNERLRHVYDCVRQLWEPLDEFNLCAWQLKQVKGMLNEHDFEDRLRAQALRGEEFSALAIVQQNQRRAEYAHLKLYMHDMLLHVIPLYQRARKAIVELRHLLAFCQEAAKLFPSDVEKYAAHAIVLHFARLNERAGLKRLLDDYVALVAEDAACGQGLKALQFACLNLDLSLERKFYTSTVIPFELQFLESPEATAVCTQLAKEACSARAHLFGVAVLAEQTKALCNGNGEFWNWQKHLSRLRESQALFTEIFGKLQDLITGAASEVNPRHQGSLDPAGKVGLISLSNILGAYEILKHVQRTRSSLTDMIAQSEAAYTTVRVDSETELDKLFNERCPTGSPLATLAEQVQELPFGGPLSCPKKSK